MMNHLIWLIEINRLILFLEIFLMKKYSYGDI